MDIHVSIMDQSVRFTVFHPRIGCSPFPPGRANTAGRTANPNASAIGEMCMIQLTNYASVGDNEASDALWLTVFLPWASCETYD